MHLSAVIFAFFVAAAPTATPSFAGDWAGEIQIPGAPLAVTIHVGDEPTPTATLDIPTQQLKRHALSNVVVNRTTGQIGAAFTEAGATFNGTVVADRWKGVFAQAGAELPFILTRTRKDVIAKQKLEAIAALIEAGRSTAQIPGIGVGVVVDGKVVWSRGFGQRDVANKLPVTSQTLFMIGSTTKAFTTAALGTLKDKGVLTFKDRVRQHLPAFDLADDRDLFLTIEDLASHGTGVDRSDIVWYLQPPKTRTDVLKTLPLLKLNQEARVGFNYNNWMYTVLGIVIEEKTGQSFADVVKNRLLLPLGMTSTAMDFTAVPGLKNRSLAYDRIDDAIAAVPWHVNPQMQPAGSASVSTIDDMNRWMMFHLGDGTAASGKRVLDATTLKTLHTPVRIGQVDLADADEPLNDYGYAWASSVWRGHTRISHSGGIDGFMSLVTLMPNENIGVVVLQNTTHGVLTGSITDQILQTLLDLPTRDRVALAAEKIAVALKKSADKDLEPPMLLRAGTKPAHSLGEYTGRYSSSLFADVIVDVVGEQLTLTFSGVKLGLRHGHYESFVVDTVARRDMAAFWKAGAFTFTTSIDGEVDGIDAIVPAMGNVVLTKKSEPPPKATLALLAGSYELEALGVEVKLVGSGLQMIVPGQPTYTLQHERGLRFKLASLEGFAAAFVVDAAGLPTTLMMYQPQGTVRLTPKR